jgi:Divergent InlB B-repeat domain/Fibronectin type III domain
MVGVGYNDTNQTMYIHDTWDYSTHTMTWNGSYSGMDMYAVSIVHPVRETLPPGFHNDGRDDITYSTGWQTGANAEYFNNDNHYSTTTGYFANFSYDGGIFKVVYTGNTDHGQMNVYVDGSLAGTIDQYSASFAPQSSWTSSEYAPGLHSVRLEHASGSIVDIDAIEIFAPCFELTLSHTGNGNDPTASPTKSQKCETEGEYNSGESINLTADPAEGLIVGGWTGTDNDSDSYNSLTNTLTMPSASHTVAVDYIVPPGSGTYENTDSRINYEGGWVVFPDNNASGGSSSITDDGHYPSASFTFTGTRVSLLYKQALDRSRMDISIDGNHITTLTQYGEPTIYQKRWDSPFLEEGVHEVVFSHDIYWSDGGRYSDIDAIIISTPERIPPAATTLSATTGSNLLDIDLNWIAPGDDGNTGTATEYIIRYAFDAIDTEAKWEAAGNLTGEPAPQVAGTAQSMTVSGMSYDQPYYFAIRTVDEVGNISDLSNSPSAISKAPYHFGVGKYENIDPNIYYTGDWTIWNDSRTSGGNTQYSISTKASASFKFTGSRISVIYTKYSTRGGMYVYIDNNLVGTIDQYGDSLSFQNRWDSPIVSEGNHSVRLVNPEPVNNPPYYVEVDAIIVSNPESIPPAATNLTAISGSYQGEVDLNWNAPGDDGNAGTATEYVIRFAQSAIDTEAKWNAATDVPSEPTPQAAGTAQSMTISNLTVGEVYYFALRAVDEVGNTSDLSNSPSAIAMKPDPVPAGTYENDHSSIIYTGAWSIESNDIASDGTFSVTNDPTATATLDFIGRQIVFNFIRDVDFSSVFVYLDGNRHSISQWNAWYTTGSTTTMKYRWISPVLENGTHTIEVAYAANGDYNNIDSFTVIDTPDTEAPAAIELSAATGSNYGQVDLNWNAPGDDGNTGTATEYLVRYAASAIDSQSAWDAATDVTGEPVPQVAGTAQTMTISGLTPGQTYYFVLRTLDDSDNLSDLSNSPSAAAKSPTPVGVGTYENEDSNIIYSGNWTVWNTASASGGSTRYSNDTTTSASLTFSGRQVSLLFTGYSSRGNIEITIDGGTPVLVNQYSSGLTFQNRWDSPLMDAGTHTVEFSHPGGTKYIDLDAIIISDPESNPPAAVTLSATIGSNTGEVNLNWIAPGDDGNSGTATEYLIRYAASAINSQSAWDAAIDASGEPTPLPAGTAQSMTVSGLTPGQTYFFALRTLDDSGNLSDLSNSPSAEAKAPTPVGTGLYQENDPNIIYTGNWETWGDGRASGGSITYSNDNTATATLTFTGKQIDLIFTRYTTRGDIKITIDGYEYPLFNQYGSSLYYQSKLLIGYLSEGTHTIVFSHPGGSHYIDIDALEVHPEMTYSSHEITKDGSFAVDADGDFQN